MQGSDTAIRFTGRFTKHLSYHWPEDVGYAIHGFCGQHCCHCLILIIENVVKILVDSGFQKLCSKSERNCPWELVMMTVRAPFIKSYGISYSKIMLLLSCSRSYQRWSDSGLELQTLWYSTKGLFIHTRWWKKCREHRWISSRSIDHEFKSIVCQD